ncbi:MAG: enoyl-CoA hydratase/isomerase family protein, partial [Acidobacteriota bacterium]|nr:enoyl-CoA hydratase/isomerase family protein [Acidobacteriota bacterium]
MSEVLLSWEERSEGRVATLTVSNPGRLNILSSAVLESFESGIEELACAVGLRVVIVRGAGERAFIGGADVGELAELTPDTARAFISSVHRVCQGLRDLPVP